MDFSKFMNNTVKLTENGALAYNTTSDAVLDLFATIGALRMRAERQIEEKFKASYEENPYLTIKMLFYAGDIRGGLGERRTFKTCLRWLALNHPEVVINNLQWIPYYNRWDSLFVLFDTPCEEYMLDYLSHQFDADVRAALYSRGKAKGLPVSLLAKWLPSENASSKKTRKLAKRFISAFEMSPREYRKYLSFLRNYIGIIETKMSENCWDEIDFSTVPSVAMNKYHKAFEKKTENFSSYLEAVKNGKAKINAGVLMPHQVSYVDRNIIKKKDETVEAQWNALPNYVKGENNYIVMADISGSMYGNPIKASVGLAIYFAERNKGLYHNKFMTFSSKPSFINLTEGGSLYQHTREVYDFSNVGYSTDLRKAFELILETAMKFGVSNEEMPKALIVISDMEIDYSVTRKLDFINEMKSRYEQNGYELPKIVLWNVDARNDTFLTNKANEDVIFISGYSTTAFSQLCQSLEGKTNWDFMVDILTGQRYSNIFC